MSARGPIPGDSAHMSLCLGAGVWGKQVSCFFQGVSGNNVFEDNVCMNGPRAQVNINDGFMGLSRIEGNVLFNGCEPTVWFL